MIRTTREAAAFGLWRDADLLERIGTTENLTTARYEPITRNALGAGHVDLLFETVEHSCVMSGLRLDPNNLVTRERSPFVWPAQLARALDEPRLVSIEIFLTPWLRSLARARPMAQESIRRFSGSTRFDRARSAGLLGAARLETAMRLMAPFIYARRFAAGAGVWLDCVDEALGVAVLDDIAASIGTGPAAGADDSAGNQAFARGWYGIGPRRHDPTRASDLFLVDRGGPSDGPIVIETSPLPDSPRASIDVPSPVPYDVLFTFDAGDAPIAARFSVHASESPLRPCPPFPALKVIGGSAGNIVLAMSADALSMRGADVDEAEVLMECLEREGFVPTILADVNDRAIAEADLVHIFGGTAEPHTVAFAQAARERGVDYVFDVSPRPLDPSGYIETMLPLALRAASDDAETERYLKAYEARNVAGTAGPEPSAQEYADFEARFADLASGAVAVLAAEEEIDALRARLPPSAAERVVARGIFCLPEPEPAAIGHLVPRGPFGLVHAVIGARSHALFVALAAQRLGVPLVVAGPCYDAEYLQTLRTVAPDAVVLADAGAGVISALYRCATIWIDAAPRPRSVASLARAAACGALPVVAAESPLTNIGGAGIRTFRLTSLDECSATLVEAIGLADCDEQIAALQARFGPRRDLASSFGGLMAAYSRATAPASA